jgi:uncharacterized Zn-finger protein
MKAHPKQKAKHAKGESYEIDQDMFDSNIDIRDSDENFAVSYIKDLKTKRVRRYLQCKYPGCKKIFRREYNLKNHVRMHTGEKPY